MSVNTVTTSNALGTADTADGFLVGKTATSLVGYWGTTPIVQPSGASQAAVTTTASQTTTPYGYSTSAQADGIVTLLNAIRAALVAAGIMKGGA